MASVFPKRIQLNESAIHALELMYVATLTALMKQLYALDYSNKMSRAQIMAMRLESQAQLQDLGKKTGEWISEQAPYQYVQGQQQAAAQQSRLGDKVAAGLILGGIAVKYLSNKTQPEKQPITEQPLIPQQNMYSFHDQSIQAIMDDMSSSFATALTTMGHTMDNTINRIQALNIRREIATAAKEEASAESISKQITATITKNGVTALIDKGGKHWEPDVYARMLVRTKLTEARNNGLMNALLSVGKDLVEVSSHGAVDKCGPWEGKILSITGDSKLYPSVADAYSGGLFHPNCQHVLNSVNEELLPSGK